MNQLIVSRDTIIAQCTPQGSGALALLRLAGPEAFSIATTISKLASNKLINDCRSHTIHSGWIINQAQEKIDHVLFMLMRGPRTFTGEDTVEITCHNNPYIIEAIIQESIQAGARLAQHGEFSKRAYLNNKIDLIQAEAINELIHASNHITLQGSLAQLKGSFSAWITELEKELLKAIAFAEASFEFLDEEMDFSDHIKEGIDTIILKINEAKQYFDQRLTIKEGFRICLIGSVNAGKSSLFNALLNKQRAIVTPIAGTTRDVIEAGLYRNNFYFTLVDTAGIRQTQDSIEQEGIKRSLQEAERADIILLVIDSSKELTSLEKAAYLQLENQFFSKCITVYTKSDLPLINTFLTSRRIDTSVHNESSILSLLSIIDQQCATLLSATSSPFLINKRHHTLLITLEQQLHALKLHLSPPVAYELVSHHLRDSLEILSELTGKTINERSLDTIFREFCVGK